VGQLPQEYLGHVEMEWVGQHTPESTVEHLGSGIPRILEVYGKKCFSFSENFLRMILPNTPQVTDQVRKLLIAMDSNSLSAAEIMTKLKLNHRPSFRESYLKPALELKLIEMTIPDKPNSSLQKYRRVG
jgi:hypothetical protein